MIMMKEVLFTKYSFVASCILLSLMIFSLFVYNIGRILGVEELLVSASVVLVLFAAFYYVSGATKSRIILTGLGVFLLFILLFKISKPVTEHSISRQIQEISFYNPNHPVVIELSLYLQDEDAKSYSKFLNFYSFHKNYGYGYEAMNTEVQYFFQRASESGNTQAKSFLEDGYVSVSEWFIYKNKNPEVSGFIEYNVQNSSS